MKTTERIKRALRNPRLFARGFNRAYHRRGGLRSYNPSGVDVFDEDWDTLVVLDACRYDMFEQVNHIDGHLTERISKGSATAEWLQANLDGRDLRDTVYVTANPQFERNRESIDVTFYDVVNVWLDEGWDDDAGTVLAETMTEAATDAHEQYPQKRLVVHYMQPHYPFVPAEIDSEDYRSSIAVGDNSTVGENVWNKKFISKLSLSRQEIWDAYVANLEYVLGHVENVLAKITGKTVITSDHGNYVGERTSPIPIHEYGHPRGLYDNLLVAVPWLEIDEGDRREVITGKSVSPNDSVNINDVIATLRDFGYWE